MIIDFDGSGEGEWFSFFSSRLNERGEIVYDDPKPDAGRFRIRSMVPFFQQREATRKQKAEFILNPKTRSMERVVFFEEPSAEQLQEEREDATDYCITGIENVFDRSGNPVECTRENKLRLIALPVVDRFVARCLQMLSESGVKLEELERKNV